MQYLLRSFHPPLIGKPEVPRYPVPVNPGAVLSVEKGSVMVAYGLMLLGLLFLYAVLTGRGPALFRAIILGDQFNAAPPPNPQPAPAPIQGGL